jgi:DNA polymerase sigma
MLLNEIIVKQTWVEHCDFIRGAKVPIIKVTDKESGISIDIQNSSADGIETAKIVISLCKQYPEIRPIILILKS